MDPGRNAHIRGDIKMGRASSVQIFQYITAILLILFLGFHLAERIPWVNGGLEYHESLNAENVNHAYNSYGWVLATLAVIALFHGLNGARGILLEWKQGKAWTLTVNALFVILVIGLSIFAIWTVVGLPEYGG